MYNDNYKLLMFDTAEVYWSKKQKFGNSVLKKHTYRFYCHQQFLPYLICLFSLLLMLTICPRISTPPSFKVGLLCYFRSDLHDRVLNSSEYTSKHSIDYFIFSVEHRVHRCSPEIDGCSNKC